jgi:serine/threonine-protein kinase SRPK3
VALKILARDTGRRELEIMLHIKTMSSKHPSGSESVLQLLDYFEFTGPNGAHLCLVVELTGSNVTSFFEGYRNDSKVRVSLTKIIAKHVLQGLRFLRECGVIHNGNTNYFNN